MNPRNRGMRERFRRPIASGLADSKSIGVILGSFLKIAQRAVTVSEIVKRIGFARPIANGPLQPQRLLVIIMRHRSIA